MNNGQSTAHQSSSTEEREEKYRKILVETQAEFAMRLSQIQKDVEALKFKKSEAVKSVNEAITKKRQEADSIMRTLREMSDGHWTPPIITLGEQASA